MDDKTKVLIYDLLTDAEVGELSFTEQAKLMAK